MAPQAKKDWRVRALRETPEGDAKSLTEAFLRLASLRMLEVDVWKNAEPATRRRERVNKPSLAARRSCKGLQRARTKEMPEAMPVRRGCERWNARAKATRVIPPNRGPRPNRSETKNPEAASALQFGHI